MHPYTSGGRIPTNKGYRYYVDFLIPQAPFYCLGGELLDNEKEQIIKEYRGQINRLEDILDKTSEIISMVTHYTGIASFLEWQDKFFYKGLNLILEQPEFKDFKKIRLLIKIVEEKNYLLSIINREFTNKVRVYIDEELGCPEIEGCSLVVSSYCIKDKPLGRLAVLGPMRMEYGHIISTLEYLSDVLTHVLSRI